MKANPDDPAFLNAVKNLKEGQEIEVEGGTLLVEARFTKPTHFPFHQRIFPAGIILHKNGSNVRIFIEAEKIGMTAEKVGKGQYDDRQKQGNKVLPADRGIGFKG